MERLGRDPLLYSSFLVNDEDFSARELRDEISQMIIQGKDDAAKDLLEKLKRCRHYKPSSTKGGLNYQSVLEMELSLFTRENSYEHPDVEKKIFQALKLTIPKFDIEKITRYLLAGSERSLIADLAAHYMQAGNLKKAAVIYDALITYQTRQIVDEYEMARTYAVTSFNYSTCLGRMGRRNKALDVIDEALAFAMCKKRLTATPSLIANKAYNLMMLEKKEASLAYFAMACFGFVMFPNSINAKYLSNIQSVVQEKFSTEIFC